MKISSKISLIVGIVIAIVVGFFGGMEYKAYEVRSAIQQAFSQININTSTENQSQNIATSTQTFLDYSIGQEVVLETLSLKVINSKEESYLQGSFGLPTTADPGTKFVVTTLSVMNLTNADFTLPSDAFSLMDGQGRLFKPYQNTIGNVDNYLAEAQLAPSIPKRGVFVYELPIDATSYSLITAKGGSGDVYRVKLK